MRKIFYILIVLVGLLQPIGYLTNIKLIRSLGVVSASSPLPIVFTEVKGVETFASDFYLEWLNKHNQTELIRITPKLYSKLKGPYNRRNIFGAAIAYGPVLPEQIWGPVINYGLCKDILKNEFLIPVEKSGFSVLIKTRTKGRSDQWRLKAECIS
jgi:hypothetical protein